MFNFNVLDAFDTVFSADCVEFDPTRPNIMAAGTYQVLEPNPNSLSSSDTDEQLLNVPVKTNRTGRLYIFDTISKKLLYLN